MVISTAIIMKKLFLLPCFFLLIYTQNGFGARVDTVKIYSEAMAKEIPAVVITPDSYANTEKNYPVLYLLHGHSDSYAGWTTKAESVPGLADQHQMIVVCPDGGYDGWYIDSPVNPASQYETHVAEEVVKYVDENYRTIQDRKARAITGLSMGGHGGLFLGIRHQNTFGAAGSMSGGVNLTYDVTKWGIAKHLGAYEENPMRWDSLSVVNLVDQIQLDNLTIMIDCGVDDFFIEINRDLHRRLLESDIPHNYLERPGAHNWMYWDNAIKYQMLFFSEFFKKTKDVYTD